MPTYLYTCDRCGIQRDRNREVDLRNHAVPCPECVVGWLRRTFVPTANVFVHEHFRHNQADFVPPKGSPLWDDLVPVSEVKERQSNEVQTNFKKALEQEFLHE